MVHQAAHRRVDRRRKAPRGGLSLLRGAHDRERNHHQTRTVGKDLSSSTHHSCYQQSPDDLYTQSSGDFYLYAYREVSMDIILGLIAAVSGGVIGAYLGEKLS